MNGNNYSSFNLHFLKSLGEYNDTNCSWKKKYLDHELVILYVIFSFVWQILLNLDFIKNKMICFGFFFGHLVISTGLLLFVWWFPLVVQMVKNLPTMQETPVWSLGWEDPLEKGMTTLFSILAWNIPWTEEPGRLHKVAESNTTERLTVYCL